MNNFDIRTLHAMESLQVNLILEYLEVRHGVGGLFWIDIFNYKMNHISSMEIFSIIIFSIDFKSVTETWMKEDVSWVESFQVFANVLFI